MSIRSQSNEPPIGWFGRAALIGLVASILVCFAVAWTLSPDPRGYGTHQQLGLPPCTFQLLFRCPCPGCGMTTSFSHFVRGHFLSAYQANPAGLVLASVMALLIPWSLKSLLSGHFWLTSEPMMSATLMAVFLSVVVLLVWSLKMVHWVYLAAESVRFDSWC